MYKLKYETHFDAAHKLNNYEGKCANLHGHRWIVAFDIAHNRPLIKDMVVDFSVLKEIVNELDHKCINDLVEFNPTAENLSKYFYNKVMDYLKENKIEAEKLEVTIWESPKASITYTK